ncbi:MAG TPA: small ribosomal subunit Rsm22 family protein [Candidatus Methanoperedens sp.]
MTSEILSLAKYLASSRAEFPLSEMNLYLSEKHEEKDLYALLKPHLYDLSLFCDANYRCQKLINRPLPKDESIIRELESLFKSPRLPARIEKLVESHIEASCGKNWHKGAAAQVIRENIVKQKEEYWKGKSQYPKIRIISYLLYHFPVYFGQFQYLLLDLFKCGLLTTRMSFLDVGAGPGTITLSTLDFLDKLLGIYSRKNIDMKMNIRIGSIEKEQENIECYRELTSSFLSKTAPANTNIFLDEPIHAPIEKVKIQKESDIIIFSNVLTELRAQPTERAGIVERIASSSKNPTIIIIEPADLVNSKALRVTQRALVGKGFNVFSPCTPIWGVGCACSDCWSFYEPGNIQVPGFMRKIAGTREPYRYINTDMKFSFAILKKDGKTRHDYRAKGKFVRLSNLKKHIGKRINIVAPVMSGNLGDEKTFVFKLCDATTSVPCYAVLPAFHMTGDNKKLLEAGYGDIVEILNTLVRENEEFSSYNLLITRNTAVVPVQ